MRIKYPWQFSRSKSSLIQYEYRMEDIPHIEDDEEKNNTTPTQTVHTPFQTLPRGLQSVNI